jgi:hypothetical protein
MVATALIGEALIERAQRRRPCAADLIDNEFASIIDKRLLKLTANDWFNLALTATVRRQSAGRQARENRNTRVT